MTEDELLKIDKLSKKGTELVCIKNYGLIHTKYDNYRNYLVHKDDINYIFEINKIYIVKELENECVFIDGYNCFYVEKDRNPYIFEYFRFPDENEDISFLPKSNYIDDLSELIEQSKKIGEFMKIFISPSISNEIIEFNMNDILDKINLTGIHSLTEEELDFLNKNKKD